MRSTAMLRSRNLALALLFQFALMFSLFLVSERRVFEAYGWLGCPSDRMPAYSIARFVGMPLGLMVLGLVALIPFLLLARNWEDREVALGLFVTGYGIGLHAYLFGLLLPFVFILALRV